jgi:hypothetical protein
MNGHSSMVFGENQGDLGEIPLDGTENSATKYSGDAGRTESGVVGVWDKGCARLRRGAKGPSAALWYQNGLA